MKICVIVPMYNEEAIARESIGTILKYVRELPPVATLIVVNDGSKDRTGEIAADCLSGIDEKEALLITHDVNRGYGKALRTGIECAMDRGYDYALFMDSDLTNHPKYLRDFYRKMEEGWDYIKATRYSGGGRAVGVPWKHRVLSIVGNALARRLYGLPLTDITNGFRAVRVALYESMELRENDFAIILEELCEAKRVARSFTEVPYVLTSRQEGQGTTRFPYSPKTCARYLCYAIKSRRRKPGS